MNISDTKNTLNKDNSNYLFEKITEEIELKNSLPFSRFMEIVLYDDKFGYYKTKKNIFGQQGDFQTAPNLSPLFAQAFINDFVNIFNNSKKNILEIGAGNGNFCLQLLQKFREDEIQFDQYCILESSEYLIEESKKYLKSHLHDDDYEKVNWIMDIPQNYEGIIFLNEFFDALPTNIYQKKENALYQKAVSIKDNELGWLMIKDSNEEIINSNFFSDLSNDYTFEFSPMYRSWAHKIKGCLKKGALIIVDYGFHESEFFHHDRHEGTLMCYFKQCSNQNPFINLGQQDISCHVNFSYLNNLLNDSLDLVGYVTQANYLINAGILDLIKSIDPASEHFAKVSSELNLLLSPAEMGELVKVIAYTKELDMNLAGFKNYDRAHIL